TEYGILIAICMYDILIDETTLIPCGLHILKKERHMAESFGIPQIVEYLKQMGLRLANVDEEQEIIEMAFHGSHGQWRRIVGIQQQGEVRKLMLIAPHIGT